MNFSIFVLEKESFLLMMIEQILNNREVKVYSPDNFEDYEYIIADVKPQVLVIDYQTFVSYPFSITNYAQIPVFFMGTEADKQKADKSGLTYQEFIFKPISPDTVNRIGNLAKGH